MSMYVRFALVVLLSLVFPYCGDAPHGSPGLSEPAPPVQDLHETVVAAERFPDAHETAHGARGTVPDLVEVFTNQDEDEQARKSAVASLAGMGLDAQEAIPALVQTLQDKGDPLRSSAAWALGLIGAETGAKAASGLPREEDKAVRRALIEALQDRDKAVRKAAAEALGTLGQYGGGWTAIPALTQTLNDEENEVRIAAAVALIRINRDATEAVPVLFEGLDHEAARVRRDCAEVLGRVQGRGGADILQVFPPLITTLEDEDEYVRLNAAISLAWLWHGTAALSVLVDALANESPEVRIKAIHALGATGPKAAESVPALIRTLRADRNDGVRESAAMALGRIGPVTDGVVPALVETLEDKDEFWRVRCGAAGALGAMSAEAKAAVPALTQALADKGSAASENVFATSALVRIRRDKEVYKKVWRAWVPSEGEEAVLEAHQTYLDSLDRTDLDALRKVVEYFKVHIFPLSGNGRSQAIRQLEAFIQDFVIAQAEKFSKASEKSDEKMAFEQLLFDNGLQFGTADYSAASAAYLSDLYSKPILSAYLTAIPGFLGRRGNETHTFSDWQGTEPTSLPEAFERVRVSIQRWESMLWYSCPSGSMFRKEAQERLRFHLERFMRGPEDYPAFLNGELRPEVKRIFRSYRGSWLSTKLVAIYYGILARNQFRWSEEAEMFIQQLKEYGAYLDNLDSHDINSIGRGIAYYKENIAKRPAALRDAAYFQFRDYFDAILRAQSLRFYRRERDFEELMKTLSRDERDKAYGQHYKEMEMQMLSPDPVLQANGIWVREGGEGGWVLDRQPDFFVRHLVEHTSAAVRDYLSLERRELERPSMVDGHIVLPFAELPRRVRNWERYLDDHPYSLYRSEARENYSRRLRILLGGENAALLFDHVSGGKRELLPGVKEAYEQYIEEHVATDSGKKIAELYSVLEKHDFKWTKQLAEDLKSKGIRARAPVGIGENE